MTRGYDLDQRPSELERCLQVFDSDTIAEVRKSLFNEAKACGLAGDGSMLVQRKKTNSGKSVKQKHVADAIQLVRSIKNRTSLPRTLLRNGKRSTGEWQVSQTRVMNSNEPSSPCSDSRTSAADCEDSPQIPTAESTVILDSNRSAAEEKTFRSTVVRDIGSLKTCVDTMKSELQELKSALSKDERSEDELDTCMLYIRFKKVNDDHVDKILATIQVEFECPCIRYDM